MDGLILFSLVLLFVLAIAVQVVYSVWYGFLVVFLIFLGLGLYIAKRTQEITPIQSDLKYKYKSAKKEIRDSVSKKLSGSLKIKTTKDVNDTAIPEFVAYLEKNFPKVFLATENINVGKSLLLKLSSPNKKEDAIILCSHMDVVEASGEWKHPPYGGKIDSKYVWGRGAIDCKGNVIAILEAIENLLSKKFEPNCDIYIAFGHDEEIGGTEGASKMAKYLKDHGVRARLVLDEGTSITKAFRGKESCAVATIAVSEKSIMTLKLSAESEGGHAAHPGDDLPFPRLCEAVCRIEAMKPSLKLGALGEEYFTKIAPVLDGKYRMMLANRWLFDGILKKRLESDKEFRPLVKNTIVATCANGAEAFNIIPREASVIYNIRMLPNTSHEKMLKDIENAISGLDIKMEVLFEDGPALVCDFTNDMFSKIEQSIKERFGNDVIVTAGLMPGATDSKYYEVISDNVYRFSPFVIRNELHDTVHNVDERIPTEALAAATEFYIEFISKITK